MQHSSTMSPTARLEKAAKQTQVEVERVVEETQERAETVQRLARELASLASESAYSIPVAQCGGKAAAIERTTTALQDAINALALVKPASYPMAEAFPHVWGLAAAYETRAKEYRRQQEQERERQSRAAAFAEEEAFEESLKERLRRGERVDVEGERHGRRLSQEHERLRREGWI